MVFIGCVCVCVCEREREREREKEREKASLLLLFINLLYYCFLTLPNHSHDFTVLFQEVLNNYEVARGQFPNALVTASTLDQYVSALKASRTSYPTMTKEVGDTWIMGVQSDPRKIAVYRTFANVLAQCFEAGKCV